MKAPAVFKWCKDRSGSFPTPPKGSFPFYDEEDPPIAVHQPETKQRLLLASIAEEEPERGTTGRALMRGGTNPPKSSLLLSPPQRKLSRFLCQRGDRQDTTAMTVLNDDEDDTMPLLEEFSSSWSRQHPNSSVSSSNEGS